MDKNITMPIISRINIDLVTIVMSIAIFIAIILFIVVAYYFDMIHKFKPVPQATAVSMYWLSIFMVLIFIACIIYYIITVITKRKLVIVENLSDKDTIVGYTTAECEAEKKLKITAEKIVSQPEPIISKPEPIISKPVSENIVETKKVTIEQPLPSKITEPQHIEQKTFSQQVGSREKLEELIKETRKSRSNIGGL